MGVILDERAEAVTNGPNGYWGAKMTHTPDDGPLVLLQ
jgi:hypothetical protein